MRPLTTLGWAMLREVVEAGVDGAVVAARRAQTMIALEKRGFARGSPSTCPARNAGKTYRVHALEAGEAALRRHDARPSEEVLDVEASDLRPPRVVRFTDVRLRFPGTDAEVAAVERELAEDPIELPESLRNPRRPWEDE